MKGKWTLRMLGVTWGPDHTSYCHSNRFTAPGLELRGAKEEALRLRFATCITMFKATDLRQTCTDWFWVMSWLLLVILISDAAQDKEKLTEADTCQATLLVSVGLESWAPMWLKLHRGPQCLYKLLNPDRFLFHSMSLGHLKSLLMLDVRLPASLPSYNPSLMVHFS